MTTDDDRAQVRVAVSGNEIVLAVLGRLDDAGAAVLDDALKAAMATEPRRAIAIDLTRVTLTTTDGVRALNACSTLAAAHGANLRFLAGGLTTTGPGE